MREMLGHDGPPRSLWTENLLTGEPLTVCPMMTLIRAAETNPSLKREFDARLRDYQRYERGVLYLEGGSADQPARWLDFMDRIDEQKNATEAKHLELMRKNGEEESAGSA